MNNKEPIQVVRQDVVPSDEEIRGLLLQLVFLVAREVGQSLASQDTANSPQADSPGATEGSLAQSSVPTRE